MGSWVELGACFAASANAPGWGVLSDAQSAGLSVGIVCGYSGRCEGVRCRNLKATVNRLHNIFLEPRHFTAYGGPVISPTPEPGVPPETLHPRLTPTDSKHTFRVICSSSPHPEFSVTWFTQNGNPGARGNKHSDDDLIAALDYRTYGPGDVGAKSKYRGQKIRVSWQGKSVDVTVEEACPTCSNSASAELSTAAFKALAPLDVKELTVGRCFQGLPRLRPLMHLSFLGTVPGSGDLHQRPTEEIDNIVVAVPPGRFARPLRFTRLFGADDQVHINQPQDGK